ncbi:MAG: hypothetical protein P8X90_29360 [Desulfobacterales bacterium]|jgi:hypothetical protein
MVSSAQHDATVDQLIARSGIISRQILKLYRFMRATGSMQVVSHRMGRLWSRQERIRRFLSAVGFKQTAVRHRSLRRSGAD